MKMLVHFPSHREPPIGIWWVDSITGTLQDLYLDNTSAEAASGRMTVLAKMAKDVPWESWFDQIAARSPYFSMWETIEANGDPRLVLEALVQDARRAISKDSASS